RTWREAAWNCGRAVAVLVVTGRCAGYRGICRKVFHLPRRPGVTAALAGCHWRNQHGYFLLLLSVCDRADVYERTQGRLLGPTDQWKREGCAARCVRRNTVPRDSTRTSSRLDCQRRSKRVAIGTDPQDAGLGNLPDNLLEL